MNHTSGFVLVGSFFIAIGLRILFSKVTSDGSHSLSFLVDDIFLATAASIIIPSLIIKSDFNLQKYVKSTVTFGH